MIGRFLCTAALVTVFATAASAHDASSAKSTVTFVHDRVLPNVSGKSLRGVPVEYAPGGTSPAHLHPKSAFIYATVPEGAFRLITGLSVHAPRSGLVSSARDVSCWCCIA